MTEAYLYYRYRFQRFFSTGTVKLHCRIYYSRKVFSSRIFLHRCLLALKLHRPVPVTVKTTWHISYNNFDQGKVSCYNKDRKLIVNIVKQPHYGASVQCWETSKKVRNQLDLPYTIKLACLSHLLF